MPTFYELWLENIYNALKKIEYRNKQIDKNIIITSIDYEVKQKKICSFKAKDEKERLRSIYKSIEEISQSSIFIIENSYNFDDIESTSFIVKIINSVSAEIISQFEQELIEYCNKFTEIDKENFSDVITEDRSNVKFYLRLFSLIILRTFENLKEDNIYSGIILSAQKTLQLFCRINMIEITKEYLLKKGLLTGKTYDKINEYMDTEEYKMYVFENKYGV